MGYERYQTNRKEIFTGVHSVVVENRNSLDFVMFHFSPQPDCLQVSNILIETKEEKLIKKAIGEISEIFQEYKKDTILIEVSNDEFIKHFVSSDNFSIIERNTTQIKATQKKF